jgi:hypothetical protein
MKPDRLIPMRFIEMAGHAIRPPATEAFALTSPDNNRDFVTLINHTAPQLRQ